VSVALEDRTKSGLPVGETERACPRGGLTPTTALWDLYDFHMSSDVTTLARRAREASRALALATRATKDAALIAMADALEAAQGDVLAANADDVRRAEDAETPPAMVDRLRLDASRVAAMADGLRDLARLPDPVGEVVRGSTLANGLELRQVRASRSATPLALGRERD
jgi:hypothetical protein